MRTLVKSWWLFLVVLLTGCTTPAIEYVTTPLPVPPRPELPSVSGEQLQCLSDETYTALVNRDRQRRDYAELLESIIQSTHTPQQ
ncbi:hypothetical protein [Marinobacter subterrani]|uniref:Lipoprotein n=1 Tax=Marinobacter subterrani TaxID=1658765 RepID=A0A0J7JAZ4_9GAMM|nr:hypothetical protein [Marinobacter subterrani]KMQ75342.1 hypothetical protein Msub_11544 [Marinobacter subterrani]KMQ77004.1 hypothetical protein Msub_13219 [Marinobacter subterrani]